MSSKACPNCGRPTGSAGGMCEPCRLGVPIGTEGLQVRYPPELEPPLRERLARFLRGPVALCFYALFLSGFLFVAALHEPSFRHWYVRLMTGATAISLVILLIHVFTSLDFLEALSYGRQYHWWFHEESSVDPRPAVIFVVFGTALLIGCAEFGVPPL